MSNRYANIIAATLLCIVFLLCVFSIKEDSLTMDEVAHLPSGYSYLIKKDMRLNPEHPPLIKDLAAIPLLFIKNIRFPVDIRDWQEDINGQWGFGYYFLYNAENPADQMIFWGRIPMILVLLLLGFYLFKWTREFLGNEAGILALILFCFSPTFLAHGRLVTTDIGAATGMFIAIYYFLKALRVPTSKNIILAGISFGWAQLCKFSAIILVPFFVFLAFIWWIEKLGKLREVFKILALTFILGALLIYPIYQYHVWNYPKTRQANDIEFLLSSHPLQFLGPLLAWMAKKPILRAYAQYLLGLFLVFQRATGGHTTYFLGEVSAGGWKNYFPVVYAIKEPLTFHILTLVALLYACFLIKKPFWKNPFQRVNRWIKSHFPEFAMFAFIGIYWLSSLISSLNIGVRHLLPVLPFTILLITLGIKEILKEPFLKLKYALLGVLLLWQIVSVVSLYPHFLAYFNEIAGGPDEGYIYTVDSNLDWGQDLRRLKKWVDDNGIEKIYIDYFGGGDAKYYFQEKYEPWYGTRDPKAFPQGSYLAVSATFLQGGRGRPVPGFNQPAGYYSWLDKYTPVAKIGYSIFVYYID